MEAAVVAEIELKSPVDARRDIGSDHR